MAKEDALAKKEQVILLMDCYRDLLTDKQNDYLSLYYEEDLSLSEVADEMGVSRTAVYDNIKRAVKTMENYEKRLGLLQKHIERLELISKLKEENDKRHDEIDAYLDMLKRI